MKKPLSVLVGLSLALSSLPAFAQQSSSTSSTSSSSSSVVSSSSASSTASSVSSRPCPNKTGIDLVLCLNLKAKEKANKSVTHRRDAEAHARVLACKDKSGTEKARCLKMNMVKKVIKKVEKKMMQRARHTGRRALKAEVKEERNESHDMKKLMRPKKLWNAPQSSSMSNSSSSAASSASSSSSSN